jgi:hypothetical protein
LLLNRLAQQLASICEITDQRESETALLDG